MTDNCGDNCKHDPWPTDEQINANIEANADCRLVRSTNEALVNPAFDLFCKIGTEEFIQDYCKIYGQSDPDQGTREFVQMTVTFALHIAIEAQRAVDQMLGRGMPPASHTLS